MKNFIGNFCLMRDKSFKKLFNDKEIFSDFMKSTYKFLNIDEGFQLDSLNSQVLILGDNIKVKDFFCDGLSLVRKKDWNVVKKKE